MKKVIIGIVIGAILTFAIYAFTDNLIPTEKAFGLKPPTEGLPIIKPPQEPIVDLADRFLNVSESYIKE